MKDYGTSHMRAKHFMALHGYTDDTVHKAVNEAQGRADGGEVRGEKSESRPDRRAKGGAMRGKTNVAINIHPQKSGDDMQAKKQAAMQGMRAGAVLGARQAAAKMQGAGGPPMGGGAPGGMPTGGPPGGPPPMPTMPPGGGGMMSAGGHVKENGYVRRKAGGRVKSADKEED